MDANGRCLACKVRAQQHPAAKGHVPVPRGEGGPCQAMLKDLCETEALRTGKNVCAYCGLAPQHHPSGVGVVGGVPGGPIPDGQVVLARTEERETPIADWEMRVFASVSQVRPVSPDEPTSRLLWTDLQEKSTRLASDLKVLWSAVEHKTCHVDAEDISRALRVKLGEKATASDPAAATFVVVSPATVTGEEALKHRYRVIDWLDELGTSLLQCLAYAVQAEAANGMHRDYMLPQARPRSAMEHALEKVVHTFSRDMTTVPSFRRRHRVGAQRRTASIGLPGRGAPRVPRPQPCAIGLVV
eukprot:TRINITY_DN6536_c0_g1_i1.p1 TRINITY_DN6536_c0_g1~~TRINITY_DN6536_c0_g1_i1.p1  ORF type:complete len:334 (+),score=8.68 TRINITY_DN6536_c0_g1_i1:105-1004(+)